MKFALAVLMAFGVAGPICAQTKVDTSEKLWVGRNDEGRSFVLIRNRADWQAAAVSYISSAARMPKEIQEKGPWGDFKVKIRFTVNPEGKVSNAQIKEGSGEASVDAYALRVVRSIKLLPFTADMGKEDLVFILPVNISNKQRAKPDQRS